MKYGGKHATILASIGLLFVIAGCAKLPVSGRYCVFAKPDLTQITDTKTNHLTPCVGSKEYDAWARTAGNWHLYSSQDISPNNPSPPLFLQGFGRGKRMVPETPTGPLILQTGNELGGTIVVNGYSSYAQALASIDDMFILDFKKQVANKAVRIISQQSSDPDSLAQTRKVTMDVTLKDGTVSRVTTNTILYDMFMAPAQGPRGSVKTYMLKSMTIGCSVTCHETNGALIDETFDSWENGQ